MAVRISVGAGGKHRVCFVEYFRPPALLPPDSVIVLHFLTAMAAMAAMAERFVMAYLEELRQISPIVLRWWWWWWCDRFSGCAKAIFAILRLWRWRRRRQWPNII